MDTHKQFEIMDYINYTKNMMSSPKKKTLSKMLSKCISINVNNGLSIKIFKELNTLIFKFTYNI